MSTRTITLDAESDRLIEEAARLENKPVDHWLAEHIRHDAEQVLARAGRAEVARRSGYPEEWIAQFILRPPSVEDDDPSFVAPPRSLPRPVPALDAD